MADPRELGGEGLVDDLRRVQRLLRRLLAGGTGTELEGVSAPGDSGGPALIRKDDAWLVAGLSSPHQEGSPGQYGAMNGFTRVSTFTGWIEKIIADHK